MRRAGGLLVLAALAGCGASEPPRRAAAAGATATVERRDLVARVTIDGSLGYSDSETLGAGLSGTLTGLAGEGSVVRPGGVLYRVDDTPVVLLRGPRPAWRALTPSIEGRDVRALERNLRRLGYDPYGAMTVNETWTDSTTAAVKRLQEDLGLSETGTLELGRVVFAPGPRRIGEQRAAVGESLAPGRPVLTTTSTRRQVTAALSTDDQGAAWRGDRVLVTLPDGRTAPGRITRVGSVAQTSQDGSTTVDVTVAVRSRGVPDLDRAPVSVAVARKRVRDVVTIPVVALVGRPGGGYGVEVVEGGSARLVSVTPGLFADGWVQVDGLEPGQRVAVPE